MSAQDLLNGISAATEQAPAIMRLELWVNGVGNEPPPYEQVVALYPTSAPVKPPPVPYFVVGDYINVRDAPNGNILAKPTKGTQLDIDTTTLRDVVLAGVSHKWGQIASANYGGEWVAVDLLSTTRP